MKTLSGLEVTDVAAGANFSLADMGSWRAWESDVSELLTVVAFVAQVRSGDGKIWRYDANAVGERLKAIQLQATSGILDPTTE